MAKKSKAQKRAEAEIRLFQEGRGPFVLACETSRLPMVFTDAGDRGNRIVYANESMLKLTGNTLEELLGKSFYSLIADETDAATIKEMKEAFEKGSPVDCEAKCQRKGARSFWVSVYVTPVFDVGGRRVQYFASFIEHRYERRIRSSSSLNLHTVLRTPWPQPRRSSRRPWERMPTVPP